VSDAEAEKYAAWIDAIIANVLRVVHGKREAIELAVVTLLAEGHLLIEDVPGVGKTSLAKALAASIDCSWNRIQFTPDLLPSDLIGVSIYERSQEAFRFAPGPVFANIVLADEINRASPKTQSALLEAMEERQVTVDGISRSLPAPFMVIATQNPVEHEGTYRLPESQLDRFLLRISLGYPNRSAELEILEGLGAARSLPSLAPVVTVEQLAEMIASLDEVFIAPPLKDYLIEIAVQSRQSPALELGLSPRATLQLAAAARGRALCQGRDFVVPDDIAQIAVAALAHRVVVRSDHVGRISSAQIIDELLRQIPVPSRR